MSIAIQSIILAAGKGTRMKSSLPKVLNQLANKPLLGHVIETAENISSNISIVIGHEAELVSKYCANHSTFIQTEQLGTGHAVQQAVSNISDDQFVLILYGDVPLIKAKTLNKLVEATSDGLSVLTVILNNPQGYGRIVRKEGNIIAIVEQKDASKSELLIKEVNSGILCVKGVLLKKYLSELSNNNVQKEYYLTDIIEMHASAGNKVTSHICADAFEVLGVNDKWQLSVLEREYQLQNAKRLCLQGVQIIDPNRIDIRGTLNVGKDVLIDINCIFEGVVTLGDNVKIGPNCVIKNSTIDKDTVLNESTSIDNSQIGKNCSIGPFSRIRPATVIKDNAKVGNFVETKKSTIGKNSKVSHLSYIGDTLMGNNVNIGAGTITCNYDGANKYTTEIGDNVFVGSASQLVAPVKIHPGSTIGAGSTITKDVIENELALSRSPQKSIKNWKRPNKK